MTDDKASISPALRTKVSTGYRRLDEAFQGGYLTGSAVVLSAPASDEVPLLLRDFLMAAEGQGLLICRSISAAQSISQLESDNLKILVCGESVPPSRNVIPGKSVENLTEVNIQINETLKAFEQKRVVLDVLSDVLLRHKALQTRKWLSELLARFRSRGIVTLAVINPNMHSKEEAEAVLDIFDGSLEIVEKEGDGTLRKFLRIKWMHGVEVAEKEFLLVDLAPEPQTSSQEEMVTTAPLKEPRWLTPLVSRTEELSKLKADFENASANNASLVALQGELGVGKTRLMQELALYAQSKGALVLSGGASQDGLPYAAWIEAVRQYVAQAPGELLRRILGANAPELAKLVPDIAAKLGTIPPSRALGDLQDKLRFYEAVTQFFAAVCKDTTLVLLFDDMEYADQSSLDLLEYFVRSTSNLRVLTVCSCTAEVEANNLLDQTLLKLNKQRLLESVTVKNLEKQDTTDLIRQVFGEQTVSNEFADLVYQRTAGNPFFIEEVLRSLVEDGTIFKTEKGWDRKPIQEIEIPKSVKNALKSRLAKLDVETLNVLKTASIVGLEFGLDILREVTQTQEEMLLDRIEKAIAAGLVLEVPKRKDVFAFADSRIRDVVLDDIMQSRRIRHHLKIAEAMEKVYSKNLEANAETIANHFSEAGAIDQTIKYSIIAGDRNRSIHAHDQAIRDYLRALDLVEEGKDAEKAALLEKLGSSYALASQAQRSVESYEQALTLQEKLHDFKSCARIAPELAAEVYRAKGTEAAISVLRKKLKYVEGTLESFEAARIYSMLASLLGVSDEYGEAHTWSERALAAGEKSGNFSAVTEAFGITGSYFVDSGRVDQGLPLLEKGLEVAQQHDLYFEAATCLLNLALYTYPRDLSRTRGLAFQWLELSKRENDVYGQANSLAVLSTLDWLGGNWALASEESAQAFEMQKRLGFEFRSFTAEAWSGFLYLSLGELELAEKYLQAALAKEDPKISSIVETNLGWGLLRLEEGREEEAKTHFEACVNAFKPAEFTTEPLLHVETLLHLTLLYAKGGQLEETRKMSEWARRFAETLKSDAALAMALQAEGTLFSATGDKKGAEEAYLQCLALWEKAGWPYYQAKAVVAYSEAIAQTNPEESKKRLQQAMEAFRKLGAKRDLEKAQGKISAVQNLK